MVKFHPSNESKGKVEFRNPSKQKAQKDLQNELLKNNYFMINGAKNDTKKGFKMIVFNGATKVREKLKTFFSDFNGATKVREKLTFTI